MEGSQEPRPVETREMDDRDRLFVAVVVAVRRYDEKVERGLVIELPAAKDEIVTAAKKMLPQIMENAPPFVEEWVRLVRAADGR